MKFKAAIPRNTPYISNFSLSKPPRRGPKMTPTAIKVLISPMTWSLLSWVVFLITWLNAAVLFKLEAVPRNVISVKLARVEISGLHTRVVRKKQRRLIVTIGPQSLIVFSLPQTSTYGHKRTAITTLSTGLKMVTKSDWNWLTPTSQVFWLIGS